jgi:hypothetical protein
MAAVTPMAGHGRRVMAQKRPLNIVSSLSLAVCTLKSQFPGVSSDVDVTLYGVSDLRRVEIFVWHDIPNV